MSRRIGLPVRVEMRADGQPTAFTWRRVLYRVLECNEPWHLQDRWWMSAGETDVNGGKGHSDRYYYRVRAKASGASSSYGIFCDLYRDRALNVWMLDKALD